MPHLFESLESLIAILTVDDVNLMVLLQTIENSSFESVNTQGTNAMDTLMDIFEDSINNEFCIDAASHLIIERLMSSDR